MSGRALPRACGGRDIEIDDQVGTFLRLNRARSWDEFTKALRYVSLCRDRTLCTPMSRGTSVMCVRHAFRCAASGGDCSRCRDGKRRRGGPALFRSMRFRASSIRRKGYHRKREQQGRADDHAAVCDRGSLGAIVPHPCACVTCSVNRARGSMCLRFEELQNDTYSAVRA